MRIITTTMCYPTAPAPDQGVFVQRRALALAQTPGVSLSVISPQPWCPLLRSVVSHECPGPLPASYPRMLSIPVLGWATDGLAYAHALETRILAEIDRDRRPDVIDAHFEYPDGVGAWLAGQRLQIPVVVTLRGKIVSLSRKTLRRLQIVRMLRGVNARIAVSSSLAGWARQLGGSDLTVHVIPNGVDRAVFHPVERVHARQSIRWNVSGRYVLCVGHQQRVKGFDRVLSIARGVANVLPDVRFILVGSSRGESSFRRSLQLLLAECNRDYPPADPLALLAASVPGHTLNLMYSAADLVVNASRSEGWCNAITEALACGTPVVATDVGGNPEQINNAPLGQIVPEGDLSQLEHAIITALQTTWCRETIVEAGAARSWSDTARQVHRVLSHAAFDGAAHAGRMAEAAR